MSDWLRAAAGEAVLLTVHVQPGSRRSEVAGAYGDALRIRIAAPAVDGRANAALLDFIAKRLHLPRSAVAITSGQSARRKTLLIHDPPVDLAARLQP